MYNVESKKLLAKLLAEENILVEFKKTTTAGFDTAKRTLILPILKEGLSEDIITLFIMHEVGHALFTPNEEWIACLKTHKKSIVNILEDVRIERKIQVRYPGSKSNFIKGYGELNSDRDFFSIRDEDVNELNFLNRLNLYTKLGPSLLINFNPQEYKYVLKAFETETFEDVLSLSKEIEELLKEKIDSESKEKEETSKTKSTEDGEEIDSEESDSEEEGSEEEFDDYDEDSDGENGAEYFPTEEDEFEASTLDSLQDNFDTLISDDCLEREYINVNVVDSKPFIVPHKEIINKIKFYYANQYQGLQTSKEYKLY
jgi:cobalamin biosynthesis protein CobT